MFKDADGVSRVLFDFPSVDKFLSERGVTREAVIDSYNSSIVSHGNSFLSMMKLEGAKDLAARAFEQRVAIQ